MDLDAGSFLSRHGNALLAYARLHSANSVDADDAYQQAVEILLTKAPEVEAETQLVRWMHAVVRNEALQIHRRGSYEFASPFDESADRWAGVGDGIDEVLSDASEFKVRREALARLNPDQTRCLLLRADGLGYPEICERTGFSYAKVNRLLSHGRRALRARVSMIEAGVECRRLTPLLSMVADGEAHQEAVHDVNLHLDHCLACQATLRDYRRAPSDVAALAPIGLLASVGARGWLRRVGDAFDSMYGSIQERVFGHVQTLQQGGDVATAKKVAGLAALSGALVVGGVGITSVPDRTTPSIGSHGSRSTAASPRQSGPPLAPRNGQDTRPSRRKPRPARADDLVGGRAGHQDESAVPATPVGQSAPPASDFQQPPVDAPREAATSDQTTDLAP